ncbi:ABC transporter [Kutzneria sp. CA-103260]|nr:ABC transporter [Kutzneria sp. CA-103260]
MTSTVDVPRAGDRRVLHTGPLIRRNLRVYRHSWTIIVASLLEPVMYLLSIGVGVGQLIGTVPGVSGQAGSYAQYVGAGLLATASMNAAFGETTFTAFSRLRSELAYDAMITTPLDPADIGVGETMWAAIRGLIAGTGFLIVLAVLGLVRSPWALLVVPGTLLVGFTFGALGLLAMTFVRHWQHFQLLQLVMLPMFLFATTFYPLTVYPDALRLPISCLPLYPSIELLRGLVLGQVGPGLLGPVAYLVVVGVVALAIATRRLRAILIH